MARPQKLASQITSNANLEMQSKLRQVFENCFTTMDDFLDKVLKPVFQRNEFEPGYTDLVKEYSDVKTRAEASHITTIKHVGTFDITGQDLKVFEVILDDHSNIRRSRVGIQRVVRSFLDSYERALMVFLKLSNLIDTFLTRV